MPFDSNNEPSIVFMGTPEIAAPVLSSLLEKGFRVIGVICNEDKPTGRKRILTAPPVKEVALSHGIPVFQPHRIREDYGFLEELKPDVIVTMAYGQIVPQAVLDIPKYGCLNLHGSILPKYRGAAPIQRAIMNGEKETGITLMEMIDKMDAGRMYDFAKVAIEPADNYTSLCKKLSSAASELICNDLLPYLNGELPGEIQDENQVTFAAKIKPEDEVLPLGTLSGEELVNYIRGLSETPGAYLPLEEGKFKIYSATFLPKENPGNIGEIVSLDKGIYIAVKGGLLRLGAIQLQGKNKMEASAFVNGNRSFYVGRNLLP